MEQEVGKRKVEEGAKGSAGGFWDQRAEQEERRSAEVPGESESGRGGQGMKEQRQKGESCQRMKPQKVGWVWRGSGASVQSRFRIPKDHHHPSRCWG